ncbi:MAG: hypothetical protein CEE40_10770 [Chloroflexi bacterium B3_Chlor]|nr:MAG: hypothetical protein CEE40_10770 [Chloroflexi bacterium B3_Chlor]
MSAIKRLAFVTGLILGLAGFVLIAGNILLYLLTGKLPSVEVRDDGRPVVGLVSPQEVVTIIKEQVDKERAKYPGAHSEGGEPF